MKKLNKIFFALFTVSSIFAQTDSATVEFKVFTKSFKIGEEVFVAGNHYKLGKWNPGYAILNQINDSAFSKKFTFPVSSIIEFKFTKGSWATEALNEDKTVQSDHRLKVERDTTLLFSISSWKDEINVEVTGQITGDVEYVKDFKTRIELLPRDLIVWLPPGYYKNTQERYPVLYMNDGQNVFDPTTSFLGVDWQIDETADSLIRKNIIEPIIIVGITNTYNRNVEYSENDTGYAYIDFLINDVKPFIDAKYRTKPEKENTAVAGSSMGGLISFMITWEHPEVFAKAACLSPALKIDKYDYVDNVDSYEGDKKDFLIYIDNGSVGLEDSLQTGIDEMLMKLKEKGYEKDKDYVWFKVEDAAHTEADWAKRNWRFLTLFFGKEK